MSVASPHLNPLPPVQLGGVRFLVDKERPVALLQSTDSHRFVTWPNGPLPRLAATARLVPAPNAVWVVYEEDAADSIDPAWSTAVRIGEDGSAVGVDIGRLSVIGADSLGIWATPRPWPAPGPYPGGDHVEEAPSFDGAGLTLESWGEFQRQEERWHREEFAGLREVKSFDLGPQDESAEFEVSYGWFAFAPGESTEEPTTRLDPPPAPGPSASAELVRFSIDGHIDTVTVDRTVVAIEQEGPRTVITYFPTNPVETLDQDGDAISYSYPRSQIIVDFTNGIPSTLAVGDHQATTLPTDEWDDVWADDSLDETSGADDRDHVDLTAVDGIDWSPAQISPEDIQVAVDRVVEQLEWLAEPNTVWTRRDDRLHRVESPYQDLIVQVSGGWPETLVTVEFRHREYSDALYRRRYRVFDSAGRPIDSQYLTVHLEEDIATGHHPAPRNGVIEVPDEGDWADIGDA